MPLASEGRGTGPGPQQAPLAQVGRGNARHIPPNPLILEGPSPLAFPLLPPHSYAPRMFVVGGGPRRQGTRPGSPTGFPGPEWVGEMPATCPRILRSWRVSLTSASPLLFPSSLLPTPLGLLQPEGASEGRGPGPGAQ